MTKSGAASHPGRDWVGVRLPAPGRNILPVETAARCDFQNLSVAECALVTQRVLARDAAEGYATAPRSNCVRPLRQRLAPRMFLERCRSSNFLRRSDRARPGLLHREFRLRVCAPD